MGPRGASEVTRLLRAWRAGDRQALDRLMPLVYDELRRCAAACMAGERRDHTLQPTALVHEAFTRLVNQRRVEWKSRAHFLGVAAHLMRLVLVDHARERRAAKRGGRDQRVTLDDLVEGRSGVEVDAIALDEALTRLADLDPQQARIVELRFFGGLSIEEVACVLELSPATVKRDWRMARAWLYLQLGGDAGARS